MLWAYQTTLKRSTRKTPFSMTDGAEAIIPVETRLPTSRTDGFTEECKNQLLSKHLDLMEENCEMASAKLANQKIRHRYHKSIKCMEFIPRDSVLRKVLENTRDPTMKNLGPNW